MPRRSTERTLAALRGVYEEPYRINGHRVFVAMDSRGEQVGLRTVAPGAEEGPVLDELWDDLNVTDPLPPDASPLASARAFRLIRGGLDGG